MVKKRVKLNESELRNIIRKCVMEAVSEIPAYITGQGNEEPVCYDPIDGPCYDSGEYIDRDKDMKKAYARYAHNQSDTPRSVRKDQMNADFANNRTPKPYNSKYYYDDFNLNTYDSNGDLAMKALKGDKFAKALRRNTPQGWVEAAKDSKID